METKKKIGLACKMELNPTLDQGVKVRWDVRPCQAVVQQAEEQWQELTCS